MNKQPDDVFITDVLETRELELRLRVMRMAISVFETNRGVQYGSIGDAYQKLMNLLCDSQDSSQNQESSHKD